MHTTIEDRIENWVDTFDILDEELASGGRHRVYLKALTATESLL